MVTIAAQVPINQPLLDTRPKAFLEAVQDPTPPRTGFLTRVSAHRSRNHRYRIPQQKQIVPSRKRKELPIFGVVIALARWRRMSRIESAMSMLGASSSKLSEVPTASKLF